MGKRSRLYIIGIDGATFNIVSPMVERGELPNIGSVMAQGAWAPLKSTVPAFSPVAWSSIITGVNPGRHGIADAFIHHPDYHMSFANSTYRKNEPIWSIVNSMGVKTGVMNVPLTYPPEHVGGFMITGMFTPESADDFTWPLELRGDLQKRFGKYRFEAVQGENLERVIKTTYESIEQKDAVLDYLLAKDDPDFLFMVYVETDRIQHQFWKFIDEKNTTVNDADRRRYGSMIGDVYKKLDGSIGKIARRMGPEDTLIIVSDHGFGPLRTAFSLGAWLEENGYITYADNPAKSAAPSKISSIIQRIKRKALGIAPDKDEQINRFFGGVDWANTKAFTEGAAGGVFINVKGRQKTGTVEPGAEYERVRGELIAKLLEIKDPANGEKVIESAQKREEIYHSPDGLEGIPDLVVVCKMGYHTISPSEAAYYRMENTGMFFAHRWSGRHDDYGVLMMRGPKVKKGVKLSGADVMDVTPTALHLMGLPVSNEFDGKVLSEAIEGAPVESPAGEYAISKTGSAKDFSEDEAEQIRQKMIELGYLE
ncbi:MAG: alkaline phosphatase family protein [Nitrospinae bacterium]|nr:alkaline phosphatase family protein [Nitrospinota bacterium]